MLKILNGFATYTGIMTNSAVASRGVFMNVSDATKDLAEELKVLEPATGRILGVLIQDVTATGPSYLELDSGIPTNEAKLGEPVAIRKGPGTLVTDNCAGYGETGDMSTAAKDANLSCNAGQLRVAQGGETVIGRLVGVYDAVAGQYEVVIFE